MTSSVSPLRFGVSLPTCKEGLNLPLPFASVHETVRLIVDAERFGYDSAWGNDHITAPAYVRHDYDRPPNFYEPLIVFAAASQVTSRIRLGTAVLVLPMREPVYLAKQLATLDQLSGGRIIVGVGAGAYREEFAAIHPDRTAVRRSELVDEGIEALRSLFAEGEASYSGRHVSFRGIEMAPKPVQHPLPIYVGGNSRAVIERVARLGDGWIAASTTASALRAGIAELRERAEAHGRDPGQIDVAPQFICTIARTEEEAVRRFRASRLYVHLRSLSESTLRDVGVEGLEERNLIGSPDHIVDRIGELVEAGVTTLAATSFVSDTPDQMREDMQLFAEEVIPHFRGPRGTLAAQGHP